MDFGFLAALGMTGRREPDYSCNSVLPPPASPPGERFREGASSNLTQKNIRTILNENPVGQPELPASKRGLSGNVRSEDTPLSGKQLQALPHLTTGQTLAHTATADNVSERTLHRWLNEPDFKAAYLDLREVEAEIARAELRGLALKAATTLSKAMDNPDPYISLRAAQTAVNASVKVEDTEDAKRIVRLLTKYAEEDDESNDGRTSRLLNEQLKKLSTGR